MPSFSRRAFLKGVTAAGGLAAGARLGWLPDATAQGEPPEKSAVVVLFMLGGYNALFSSAGSFLGRGSFGVNNGNVRDLGGGLVVDKATLGSLPDYALQHMATIGNRHGSTDHAQANTLVWSQGGKSFPIRLAAAMGGSASIKCCSIGPEGVQAPTPSEGGVSMQAIRDMGSTIEALVGGDRRSPDRAIAADGLRRALRMSKREVDGNPEKGKPISDGFTTAGDALDKVLPPFDYRSIPTAYGLAGTAITNDKYASKLAGAELMIRAGTNVVSVYSDNIWDNHGSRTPGVPVGGSERRQMEQIVIPPLRKFLERVHDPAGLGATHNVVTVIVGDFARSLPGGDHASVLSATVIGKYVKVGTTGRVDANVGLPPNIPASEGMWAYLAAAARSAESPFGKNPHGLVL